MHPSNIFPTKTDLFTIFQIFFLFPNFFFKEIKKRKALRKVDTAIKYQKLTAYLPMGKLVSWKRY